MRERKYQAWYKYGEEMVEVVSIHFPRKDVYVRIINLINNVVRMKFDDVDLREYVGSNDKNGKDLYEGDIVQDNQKRRWIVYWRPKYCGFYLLRVEDIERGEELGWIDLLYGGNVDKFEVIGNRWENPELLEQNKA